MTPTLTDQDLADARAIWDEWVGPGFSLEVGVVGDHQPAEMDPDRPLGAVVKATLSLQVKIWKHHETPSTYLLFDESCPYDGVALRASVKALARAIAEH